MAKASKATAKQLSNPFSSGGGGVEFENKVQAAFVALMLSDGVIPCLPVWPILKVKLQGRYSGFATDDAIVFVRDKASDRERKLLAQIKHSPAITKRDKSFAETIQSAWDDFKNPKVFRKDLDALALVTGPLTASDTYDVRDVLEFARTAEDCGDFFRKVRLGRFSSAGKREKLAVFRYRLKKANKGKKVNDQETWEFLKHFHLLGYDLDIKSGACLSLLHSHLGKVSIQDVEKIWLQIRAEVQTFNARAGILTRENVSQEIRDYFHIVLPPNLGDGPTGLPPAPTQPPTPTPPSVPATTLPPASPATPPSTGATTIRVAVPLVAASLLGSWSEHNAGDRAVIERLVGVSFSQWQDQIRALYQNTPGVLGQQNGLWTVVDRLATWQSQGPLMSDDLLNHLSGVAVSVLRQIDPTLGTNFAAKADEKHWCSKSLRKGLAETLILFATKADGVLTTCTLKHSETESLLAVRQVLNDASADLWASLNDVLPLLAEASPDEYLSAIDKATGAMEGVFQKEGPALFGRTYMSGLLWGLELLAWHENYLVTVCRVLSELAAIDPGGNWTNRPASSLTTILLPWFPQTCAPPSKRQAAVEVVVKAHPKVGWTLILSLLPDSHGTSSNTYKPVWRDLIRKDWKDGVSQKEYYDVVLVYFAKAVLLAGTEADRLVKLIERYFRVSPASRGQLRTHLESVEVMNMAEPDRLRLWVAINTLTGNHRKFAEHEHWKVPEGSLEELDAVADKLKPTSPEVRHRRLFVSDEFGLYDDLDNLEASGQALRLRRQEAVKEVVDAVGFSGLLAFARSVESPGEVGGSYGLVAEDVDDKAIVPALLETKEQSILQFAHGYVRTRFNRLKWVWVDSLPIKKWSRVARGVFLGFLPFEDETWARVRALLGTKDSEYWLRTFPFPSENVASLDFALTKLIDNGRADRVVWYCQVAKGKKISPSIMIRALLELQITERGQTDAYHIGSLITRLQNDASVAESDLRRIEFKFIQILGEFYQAQPVALSRGLAEDPEFFCEVIRTVYRSKNEVKKAEVSDEKRELARSAYHILMEWRVPPGTKRDNSFDATAFELWISSVREKCVKSGHWEIAGVEIGKVLFYGVRDDQGLWNTSICEALDAKDHDQLRRGLTTEIFNSRGVVTFTKGAGEMKLSEYWSQCASVAETRGYSRLAQSLRGLGDSYRRDAELAASQED